MRKVLVTAAAVAALVLAGCSSGGDDTESAASAASPTPITEASDPVGTPSPSPTRVLINASEVSAVLGVDSGGYAIAQDGSVCEAAVILTNPDEIALYADAGDVVVTDPTGTVGVKVIAAEIATCADYFTERLTNWGDADFVTEEPSLINISDVEAVLGVDKDGVAYADDGTFCYINPALTSPSEIAAWAEADFGVIVVDPTGSVGAIVKGDDLATCVELFSTRLEDWPQSRNLRD